MYLRKLPTDGQTASLNRFLELLCKEVLYIYLVLSTCRHLFCNFARIGCESLLKKEYHMCSFLIKERCVCITAVGLLCLPVVRFQPLQKYKYLCLSSIVERS